MGLDWNMIGIYGLFDTESGECLYVGQSSDIEYRVKRHMWNLKSYTHLDSFTAWFKSTGSDLSRLEHRILDECENIDSVKNELEMKWFHNLGPRFYGKVPSVKESWEMSEETRDRIAKSVSEYWQTKGLSTGRRRLSIVALCEYCSVEFTSARDNPRFCSVRCVQRSRASSLDIDLIRGMYDSGKTLRDISDEVGVSHVTVRRYLLEHGVTLRSPGEKG